MRNIDAQLEESASLVGAGRLAIIRRITIPLIVPSIMAAFLLSFARGLGTFGTPAFLGGPVREFVLSTSLYGNLIGQRPGLGYLAALVMIVIGMLVLYMDHRMVGAREEFCDCCGEGRKAGTDRARKVALGIGRIHFVFLVLGDRCAASSARD